MNCYKFKTSLICVIKAKTKTAAFDKFRQLVKTTKQQYSDLSPIIRLPLIWKEK